MGSGRTDLPPLGGRTPSYLDQANGPQALYPDLHERQIASYPQFQDAQARRVQQHADRVEQHLARHSHGRQSTGVRGKAKQAWCVELKRRFDSLASAGRFVNRPAPNIWQAIRKQQRCGCFHWQYFDPELHGSTNEQVLTDSGLSSRRRGQ